MHALAEEARREAVTLVHLTTGNVLYQSYASTTYYSNIEAAGAEPPALDGSGRHNNADEARPNASTSAAHNHPQAPTTSPLLTRLFSVQPELLADMLAAVRSGNVWHSVMEVPPGAVCAVTGRGNGNNGSGGGCSPSAAMTLDAARTSERGSGSDTSTIGDGIGDGRAHGHRVGGGSSTAAGTVPVHSRAREPGEDHKHDGDFVLVLDGIGDCGGDDDVYGDYDPRVFLSAGAALIGGGTGPSLVGNFDDDDGDEACGPHWVPGRLSMGGRDLGSPARGARNRVVKESLSNTRLSTLLRFTMSAADMARLRTDSSFTSSARHDSRRDSNVGSGVSTACGVPTRAASFARLNSLRALSREASFSAVTHSGTRLLPESSAHSQTPSQPRPLPQQEPQQEAPQSPPQPRPPPQQEPQQEAPQQQQEPQPRPPPQQEPQQEAPQALQQETEQAPQQQTLQVQQQEQPHQQPLQRCLGSPGGGDDVVTASSARVRTDSGPTRKTPKTPCLNAVPTGTVAIASTATLGLSQSPSLPAAQPRRRTGVPARRASVCCMPPHDPSVQQAMCSGPVDDGTGAAAQTSWSRNFSQTGNDADGGRSRRGSQDMSQMSRDVRLAMTAYTNMSHLSGGRGSGGPRVVPHPSRWSSQRQHGTTAPSSGGGDRDGGSSSRHHSVSIDADASFYPKVEDVTAGAQGCPVVHDAQVQPHHPATGGPSTPLWPDATAAAAAIDRVPACLSTAWHASGAICGASGGGSGSKEGGQGGPLASASTPDAPHALRHEVNTISGAARSTAGRGNAFDGAGGGLQYAPSGRGSAVNGDGSDDDSREAAGQLQPQSLSALASPSTVNKPMRRSGSCDKEELEHLLVSALSHHTNIVTSFHSNTVSDDEDSDGEEDDGLWQAHPICFHEVCAKPVTDPRSGQPAVLITQTDVTVQKHMEMSLGALARAQLNVLSQGFPRHIVEFFTTVNESELTATANMGNLARSHKQVTVLFMDIADFTSMSRDVPASAVLTLVNGLFTRFDAMCDVYGVQKVDTAGDSYIVSSGVCNVDDDGFVQVVDEGLLDPIECAHHIMAFAGAMLKAAKEVTAPHNGSSISIRIGIHTGDCVSGLVGTKLPKFTLFGDTMNTASRMESTGQLNRIQVSSTTKELLDAGRPPLPRYVFEATPGVFVKGKGVMVTHLWTAPQQRPGPAQHALPPLMLAPPAHALSMVPEAEGEVSASLASFLRHRSLTTICPGGGELTIASR
ncbi:hypothetical protein FOA52_015958 [Chlamydomonas sp. UWO 241]|nr:hypothetical protein FOA52_015958 [Chlamydomonas sp. UWO 241]